MTEIYAFGGYLQQHIGDGTNSGPSLAESVSLPRKIDLDDDFRQPTTRPPNEDLNVEENRSTTSATGDDAVTDVEKSQTSNTTTCTRKSPWKCGPCPLSIAVSWSNLIFARGNQIRLCRHGSGHGGTPRKVTLDKIIQHVSASWDATYVTYQDGTCHVWADILAQMAPKVVSSEAGLLSVSTGAVYTCAITTYHEAGLVEQTEEGVVLYRPLLSNMNIKSVSCGKEHVLLLTGIGAVFSVGLGSRGQLGHGTMESVTGTPAVVEALDGVRMVDISAGGWHSAAVSDIGDVYVWGWNESGQLGLPSKAVCEQIGREPRSCRCSKPERAPPRDGNTDFVNILCLPHPVDFVTRTSRVDVGESHEEREVNVISVSCGSRHTLAVTDDGGLYSWGWNDHGQLGHGDTFSRDSPCLVSFFGDRKLKVTEATAGSWGSVVLADVQ